MLPFVIYFSTSFMTPDYYTGISEDPLYMPMMIVVAGFTAANAIILSKLVRFRI
jgi:tight adherence protein B